eukprot:914054-Pyramimonas_sp.AAC.1
MERCWPRSAALWDETIGGNCCGSPTTTSRSPLRTMCTVDMAAVAFLACPASSMMPIGMGVENLPLSSAAASWD